MLKIVVAAILAMIPFSQSFAGLLNADFSSSLNGWTDASSNGSVTESGGAAVLNTGTGVNAFSAVLVQGDDGFFSFSNPIEISALAKSFEFDLWLFASDLDQTEGGYSSFRDSLTLSIYDSEDLSFDRIFSGLSFGHQSLDISGLVGRKVAFSFELADEDDGWNTAIALDNLAVLENTNVSLPEPTPGILLVLGMIAILHVRRSRTLNNI